MSGSSLLGQVMRVGPHAGSHRVAARASVSVAGPLLVLWSVGHLDWAIYAAFGAFTSLYGRNHVHLSRLQMQLTLAVVLTASVVLGVTVGLSAQREWLAVPVATLAAGVASMLSDAQDWHPPGALFVVFALAACASIPSHPADIGIAAAVAGSSSAFAVVVGAVGSAWWLRRRPDSAVRSELTRVSFAVVAPRHAIRVHGELRAGRSARHRLGDRPPLLGDGVRGGAARPSGAARAGGPWSAAGRRNGGGAGARGVAAGR